MISRAVFVDKQVGSGVGLVGILLAYVKASKVILSDGDMSTLANMKLNLELNHLSAETERSQCTTLLSRLIQCKYLSWEFASASDFQEIRPEIILGADVIYDPLCLPHLIRVLVLLLNSRKPIPQQNKTCCKSPVSENISESITEASKEGSIAYIATVIRNEDTFNYFLKLAKEAHLNVVDITETRKPFSFLPYMITYVRSSIRLFTLSLLQD
ncbi:hypothetical protein GIB67_041412 [Kingdonia uniflora]|uniref:Uncharacterized protein n=1 Tax=Kingdonia uniflora TaxID=39325 RepID=A0A7J7LRH4_9MAGN|nr:hypothetical protein GIB67_041412 [Kingdonia uniflora]